MPNLDETRELLSSITGIPVTEINTFALVIERVDEDGIPSTQMFAPHSNQKDVIQIMAAGLMSLAEGIRKNEA